MQYNIHTTSGVTFRSMEVENFIVKSYQVLLSMHLLVGGPSIATCKGTAGLADFYGRWSRVLLLHEVKTPNEVQIL